MQVTCELVIKIWACEMKSRDRVRDKTRLLNNKRAQPSGALRVGRKKINTWALNEAHRMSIFHRGWNRIISRDLTPDFPARVRVQLRRVANDVVRGPKNRKI